MDAAKLSAMITRHEGLRLKPYVDTTGNTTIGVGRNLTGVGISMAEATAMLANDIARATADVETHIPFAASLAEARQAALVDLSFNLGIGGLLKFHHFLADLQDGHYQIASDDLLQSLWAKQVGTRATEIAGMIARGTW